METSQGTVHSTFNLSASLLREAQRLFAHRSKTEIIHEALERMVEVERLIRHVRRWAGKGRFRRYE